MLITRRKQGESLLIGDAIEVVVLEVAHGRVKLGVVASPEVSVERKEWRLVLNQNQSAVNSADSVFVQGILAKHGPEAPGLRASVGLGFARAALAPGQTTCLGSQVDTSALPAEPGDAAD